MDFTPAVYEHAAFLIGRTPWEVSRDAELLREAHVEAFRRYRHTPVVVGIDIYNLEAEAYGGIVERPGGTGIPAVGRPICQSVRELAEIEPFDPAVDGRIAMVIEVARCLARELPEADVRVPLSGPFSIASNVTGFETLLCAVLEESDTAAAALMHLVEGQERFCRAVHEAGLDIAFFESAAAPPLLSPRQFRQVELPALRATIDRCAAVVGHAVPCVIGGNTAPIVDALLETGTGYVICPSPLETDQADFMRRVWDRTKIRVRVNTSSEVMVRGTRDDLRREFERIRDLTAGRKNVCLGTGALPYETPPENVHWLAELCRADA